MNEQRNDGTPATGAPKDSASLSDQSSAKSPSAASQPNADGAARPSPLERFSLAGMSLELEQQATEQVAVLGSLALQGQATVFYAAPNSGKTLISVSLLIEGIAAGRISPGLVFYVNCDDSSKGLADKVRIADEYGFHMLADGYQDFAAPRLVNLMDAMATSNRARGHIVILDTVKKFADLMDKKLSSQFTAVMRRFVLAGGTVIGLAHTNKNLREGKPVYGGTSDLVDDFDCAYTIAPLQGDAASEEKAVVFENLKRRGDVAQRVAFAFLVKSGISYDELLASVRVIDDLELVPMMRATELTSDAEVVTAIEAAIRGGCVTKMKLSEAAAKRSGVSRRHAIQIIEKYCGNDPDTHRWRYMVGQRGAKLFILLENAPPTGTLG